MNCAKPPSHSLPKVQHLKRSMAHGRTQHRPHDDAFTDPVARDSLTYLHDTTADIRALNARELQ